MAMRIVGRERRKLRIRRKINGTSDMPRLSVFRSAKHIYAQVVDDVAGTTVAHASTLSRDVRGEVTEATKLDAAKHVGASIAKLLLAKGTAIATFEDGVYKSRPHGNHAALYLSQDQGGIWVMDQWASSTKLEVSRHYLQFKGVAKDGNWIDASNNGDAFSVIE